MAVSLSRSPRDKDRVSSGIPSPHLSLNLPLGFSRGQGSGMGGGVTKVLTSIRTLTYGLVESQEAFVEVCDFVLGGVCPEGQPKAPPGGYKLHLIGRAPQRGTLLPTQPGCICSSG